MNASELSLETPLFDISCSRDIQKALRIPESPAGLVFACIRQESLLVPVYGEWFLSLLGKPVQINCLELDPRTPLDELFELFIYFESRAVALNDAEKVRAAILAKKCYAGTEKSIQPILKLLGLPASDKSEKDILRLTNLSEEWLGLLAAGRCTLKTAYALSDISETATGDILVLFTHAHLTSREQEITLEGISDLIKLGTEFRQVFEEAGGVVFFQNEESTPKEKGEKWMNSLMNRLHPHFQQDESAFQDIKKNLGIPGSIKIGHSPYFERKGVDISFSAQSVEEFRKKLEKLSKAYKQGNFPKLFDF